MLIPHVLYKMMIHHPLYKSIGQAMLDDEESREVY